VRIVGTGWGSLCGRNRERGAGAYPLTTCKARHATGKPPAQTNASARPSASGEGSWPLGRTHPSRPGRGAMPPLRGSCSYLSGFQVRRLPRRAHGQEGLSSFPGAVHERIDNFSYAAQPRQNRPQSRFFDWLGCSDRGPELLNPFLFLVNQASPPVFLCSGQGCYALYAGTKNGAIRPME
jgi:hypothetical protein